MNKKAQLQKLRPLQRHTLRLREALQPESVDPTGLNHKGSSVRFKVHTRAIRGYVLVLLFEGFDFQRGRCCLI